VDDSPQPLLVPGAGQVSPPSKSAPSALKQGLREVWERSIGHRVLCPTKFHVLYTLYGLVTAPDFHRNLLEGGRIPG